MEYSIFLREEGAFTGGNAALFKGHGRVRRLEASYEIPPLPEMTGESSFFLYPLDHACTLADT
jgi:hypothetical protein